jgi:flagellar L-ring protein precursor FlgH
MTKIHPIAVVGVVLALCLAIPEGALGKEKDRRGKPSSLDQYLNSARQPEPQVQSPTAGSLWSPAVRFGDIAADLRASRLHDVVTVVVRERVSADSQGTVSSSRTSDANSSISALAGITKATGPLANILGLNSESKLEGQGGTTRNTTLSATMTARVVEVLPNGNLVIEGTKSVGVNSENQIVMLRGVIRPYDVSALNTILSDQVAELELTVNGKGVVGDAIHRPNIFYRILRGILPF